MTTLSIVPKTNIHVTNIMESSRILINILLTITIER